MEQDEEKKKLNDDMVVFVRKRSETHAPRYTARLKRYVDMQNKRRRAAAARRRSEHNPQQANTVAVDKDNVEHKRGGDKNLHTARSGSHSHSEEPCDRFRRRKCRRRRRRRCRRRRRSCRRRRRRRSCRCRRRRRRSCSRRRRRRSCRRRRRRCRRRRR